MNPGHVDPGRANPGRANPGRVDSGRVDPGRAGPGRIDPDLADPAGPDRGPDGDGLSDAPFARRLSWPAAALLIGALSLLGWGLIGLATRGFWR